MVEPNKEWCSGWSLGMKLANLSVIDENDQNEIQNIFTRYSNSRFQSTRHDHLWLNWTKDEVGKIIQSQLQFLHTDYQRHIIWAGHPNDSIIRNELYRLNRCVQSRCGLRTLVTILTREPVYLGNRDHCIELQDMGGILKKHMFIFPSAMILKIFYNELPVK